jgi:hypothetical protein
MMHLRSFLLVAVFSFIIISSSFADNSPYQTLRFQESARSAALAGAFVSMSDDASAIFYNPASVATMTGKRAHATFLNHVLDINSGIAVYSIKPDSNDAESFGFAVSYTNFGDFDRRDQDGTGNGSFSASDVNFAATYSNIIDSNLYYGVTARFLYFGIENASSSAMTIDAGLLYVMPEKRTNIGLSILHSGFQISEFDGYSEPLPLDIRMGVNHRLEGLPLLINFTFHHLADQQDSFFDRFGNFAIGGELLIGKHVRPRIGYNNEVRSETSPSSDKKLSGFSFGLGIITKNFNVDYGLAQIGTAATLHRFSLTMDI